MAEKEFDIKAALKEMTEIKEVSLSTRIAVASLMVVGKIKPDKTRTDGKKYSYVSSDAILTHGGGALSRMGVAVYSDFLKTHCKTISYRSSNGHNLARYDYRIRVKFTLSSGAEERLIEQEALGSDFEGPDKALQKAFTIAHAKMIAKLLHISAGDIDGEHVSHPAGVPAVNNMPKCPTCKKQLRQDKNNPKRYYCWDKKGGCGAAWRLTNDGELIDEKAQPAPQSPVKPDSADLTKKKESALKMANELGGNWPAAVKNATETSIAAVEKAMSSEIDKRASTNTD